MGETRIAGLDRFWSLVNERRFEEAAELYLPDASVNLAGRVATGREAIRREIEEFVASFPDIEYRPGERLVDGDTVVEEWSAAATHGGPFMGQPPSGASIRLHAITVYRFEGELVAGDRTYLDMTPVLLRTGVLATRPREGGDAT
jgi:predicted ester cyclase